MADGGTMAILSMETNPQVKLPDSGKDSVRSTKSLSIFVNPDTPNTMARSEEMTMNMYVDSPDDLSPKSAGHSKRRHRETTDDKTSGKDKQKSESTPAAKTGFFKFAKKKKTPDTKSKDSSSTGVEITSKSSTNAGRTEALRTDAENSQNHQMELEISGGGVAASSSTQSEQSRTDKTSTAVKTAAAKSSASAASSENRIHVSGAHKGGTGQTSAALSDSNNNTATITVEPSTSAATAKSGLPEKSAGKAEWKNKVGRQQEDQKKELVTHSLPSYSPADVDLSSSLSRDKNVRAKFESMLAGQDSAGSVLSSPASVPGQPKKTYLRRADHKSTETETPEARSAASTLTRQNQQQARAEELVSSPALERMAEMQSALKAGQVPKAVQHLSPNVSSTGRTRGPATENREHAISEDELSLQEDLILDATTYLGEDLRTPPADQMDRQAVTTVHGVQLEASGKSAIHPVSVNVTKTAPKSGAEANKSLKTGTRTAASTSKTTHAAQDQKVAATKVSPAQNVQLERSHHGRDQHSELITIGGKDRPQTSDQIDRSDSGKNVDKQLQQQKTKAQTEASRHVASTSLHVANRDAEQRAKTHSDEDRDSTPTPTTMRRNPDHDGANKTRYTKIHIGRQRSPSPGAHGVELVTTEHIQRTSDQSDESVSEVEQRQHALKAQTQAELLAQAKKRSTTTDAAIGDHNVRTAAKSTYTVTAGTHSSQRNGERIPSKASLDGGGRVHGSKDKTDGRQHRSAVISGRSGRTGVNHHQPTVDRYRDGPVNVEWRNPHREPPGEDEPELRAHMRPRDHRAPARTQSNTSSDISSSLSSHSDVNHELGRPQRERRGSQSSSDATPTETDHARSHRVVPSGREPIRRSTSLPMSDEMEESDVVDYRGRPLYHVVETRQPQAAKVYPGRTQVPVSGRQKIQRTTDTSETDNYDVNARSDPRIYVDGGNDPSSPDVYEHARRQRQPPSGRPRINHNVGTRAASTSPDNVRIRSGQLYAERRTPNEADDDDLDVEVGHRANRQAPAGRTKKIPRGGDLDVRVTGTSPGGTRRPWTPTSMDERQYGQRQNVEPNVGYSRRAPAGRTKAIHHGSNVDINITGASPTGNRPISSRQASDGQRTPDWLRHRRSGQLTVDVTGQGGDSPTLHRAYRSMPDLLDDDTYADDVAPKRKSRNYSDRFDDDDVDHAAHRQPHSSNPGGRGGGRVTATIKDTTVEMRDCEQTDGYYRVRDFSVTGGNPGPSGRKRAFITGATVENRGSRGRRSGRTNDMPLTDVEDLYNDDGWRKSSHVARIYVGGGGDDDDVGWESADDVMSVFSEPSQLGRSRFTLSQTTTQRVQQRPTAILTPAHGPPSRSMPPTVPVPQGATFELAHVDTQIQQQLSPDVGSPDATISAVDPALRGASKQGTNYHITLTLKPTMSTTPTGSRQGTMTSRSQMMTLANMMTSTNTTNAMTSPDDPYYWSPSPRAVSSMAVYANDAPGWPASQPPSDRTSPRRADTRPSRATSTMVPTSRQRSRSRSSTRPSDGQIGFDVVVRSDSDDDRVGAVHSSVTKRQTNVTEVELGQQITSSVEFTYSPPYDLPDDDDDPVDFRRRQPTQAAPSPHGRQQRRPQHVDDQMTRSYHKPIQQQKPHLPEIQRGNFLIKNSIDANKPPKVYTSSCCPFQNT